MRTIGKKLPVRVENYSYTKFLHELLALCDKNKLNYTFLGKTKTRNSGVSYPLYKIIIHPEREKKICIAAGCHGYEIAGPLSMLSLIKNYRQNLRADICYWIFPMINPISFDLRQRYNDRGKNLNLINKEVLLSKQYMGTKLFYYDSKHEDFDIFVSLHEDIDQRNFYAYIYENWHEPIFRKMINSLYRGVKIHTAKRIYKDRTDGNGLIINKHDQSIESRLFLEGRSELAICTETPGKLPINTRIKINLKNIKTLSDYLAARED